MIPILAKRLVRLFEKPELWLVRCVIVACLISVVYYSSDKAKDPWSQAILILIGFAAVGFHFIGAKKACRSWYERRPAALVMNALIVMGAICWETNNQMVVASGNQDNLTNLRQTAYDTAADRKAAVNRSATKLLDLKREKAWQAVVDPAEALQAKLDNARAHKFWDMTDGCKATKGPQTRAFCDAYRQAEADKATALRKLEIGEEIKIAEQELATARVENKNIVAVASADRADFRNLKRLTALSTEDLELGQSLLMVLVMALFLTVAGWLIKAEEYEGKVLGPWGVAHALRRLYRWFYRTMTGSDPPGLTVYTDERAVGRIKADFAAALRANGILQPA